MSDIPTTHTLPEDALRMMRTAFRMDPRSARCLKDAEAEITRLRADLAAAQEREQRMREAGLLALKVAESWIHDQCDGTDDLEPALAELDEARGTLSAMRGEPTQPNAKMEE